MKNIFTDFMNYILPKKSWIDVKTTPIETSIVSSPATTNVVIPKMRPMRWVKLKITFKEGDGFTYKSTDPVERSVSAKMHYSNFYKWFIFRESSEIYCMEYSSGSTIFRKSDIRIVEFIEEDIEIE